MAGVAAAGPPEDQARRQFCPESAELVAQRRMGGRQPVQQGQVAAASEQSALQEIGVAPPVGQREIEDIAGRNVERVAARAVGRPRHVNGRDRAGSRPAAPRQEERRRAGLLSREQPIGVIRQVDQCDRRQFFDESARRSGAGPAPAEELHGAENQAEPRLVGCEVHRAEREIQALPARRPRARPAFPEPAGGGGRRASIAPGRITDNEVELPRSAVFAQRSLRRGIPLDVPGVADDERASNQGLERQRVRRTRVRIELQGGQVQTERGDAHGGFAGVHPVNLPVERGPDQLRDSACRLARGERRAGATPPPGRRRTRT